MLRSVTLQNFKSFGARQTVPLSPISVLVGANNSGKSSFMSIGAFVSAAARDGAAAMNVDGGREYLFHRPRHSDGNLSVEWVADGGSYSCSLRATNGSVSVIEESISKGAGNSPAAWKFVGNGEKAGDWVSDKGVRIGTFNPYPPFRGLYLSSHADLLDEGQGDPYLRGFFTTYRPLVSSRLVRLSRTAMGKDSPHVQSPVVTQDGSGIPTLLSFWRGGYPERAEELDAFVAASVPDSKRVLVLPSPDELNHNRLWLEQTDGERFDARHLSDGILFFIALGVQVIDAPKGAVLFIEEPEQYIHPRRLASIIDTLRRVVAQKDCQIVIATHSPILLNEFRNEPEAILLFSRSSTGTKVRQLSEVPELRDALDKADPGEMLSNGFFAE